MDELVGNLKTYEMKRKKDSERREQKEKNLVLNPGNNASSEEDSDMAYLTRRFQKIVRRNGGIRKRGSSSKPKNYDFYHKCAKPGHLIKDCPILKQEHFKHNSDKAAKRNPVPDKRFKRKNAADNVVKQVLAAWGDSSSESEEENDAGDSSMLEVESEANEYDSIFGLMAQSDDDEDDENDEVNFRDVQRNLKSYSPKTLLPLANLLIDVYHSLVSDKDALTIQLRDAEHTRDDLVVCIVDLKETIENLKNEKEVLIKKIASVEHERDDLMVDVVDMKETTENLSKEKNALVEKVAITEHERDDLLVVIADLEETIEELKADSRLGNSEKVKEIASEAHIKLENELNIVKTSLCPELEKNRQHQAKLKKVKNDLEKSLKWTWSSDAITPMYFNNGGNRQVIRFQREKFPYNPYSKYVIILDNWLCTHCGNNVHFKGKCQARV
ncbi:intracellular protein transport protein USO1-like [Nicotiana tomentosiformis]|uniref:intracellular protein transport protein USO1-like n=1 Tax=Nicotiana tomentosiformis TaxID=4098 RepID=UPI00388C614C